MRIKSWVFLLLSLCHAISGDNSVERDEGAQNIDSHKNDEYETVTVTEVASKNEVADIRAPIKYYNNDSFKYPNTESLEIKPLKDNNLLLSFNFEANATTDLYPNQNDIQSYNIIPKALGAILKSTNTRELHLRFGHGWYDSELNGRLVKNGSVSGGTGVELWATIEANDKPESDHQWTKLANYLSGMFCASLNFIDSSITTYPVNLFNNNDKLSQNVELTGQLFNFRSALPREPVCTENLTPFLVLLPTKGRAGISTLLAGNKMFNAEWSSMAVDIITECSDSSNCKYVMRQSINLIVNVPKVVERNEMPIPRPTPGDKLRCDESKIHDIYNCFPLPPSSEYDYDLIDLFGTQINGGSMITSEISKVCLDFEEDEMGIEVISLAALNIFEKDGKHCFLLNSDALYNIKFNTQDSSKIKKLEEPPIFASRSLSGYSQDSGGFRLDLHNPGDKDLLVIAFQTLPWYVRFFLHSLKLEVTFDDSLGSIAYDVDDDDLSHFIQEIVYNPAIDRKAPSHLELLLNVPKRSKMKLSFSFDKAMLLYAEYPPDANHGFELEPAVFAVKNEASGNIEYIMRTTTNLLTLPTPDFSMPYNVIIITSTVMSLAFGAIFNLLTKRTVTEEEAEEFNSQKPIAKLKTKIQSIILSIRSKDVGSEKLKET